MFYYYEFQDLKNGSRDFLFDLGVNSKEFFLIFKYNIIF